MKSIKKIYRVAVIGAGRIGSSFDTSQSKHVLSHAHAFTKNKRTKLVALVDTDVARGTKEAKKWRTKFYADVEEMFEAQHPDIVVIATPDNTHIPILEFVTRLSPKLIVCEKPVTYTKNDINQMQKFHASMPILVNYRRRFDPVVVHLREDILKGRFGNVLSASGLYTKGILHNGSHMIDLARFLLGEVKTVVPHIAVRDGDRTPSVGGFATFERCPQFYLMMGDARAYAVFEFDILTEKGRFRFFDEGMRHMTEEVIDDPVFKGFRMLGNAEVKETDLIDSMENLAEHVVAVLDGKETPRSTLQEALKTEKTCFEFIDDTY